MILHNDREAHQTNLALGSPCDCVVDVFASSLKPHVQEQCSGRFFVSCSPLCLIKGLGRLKRGRCTQGEKNKRPSKQNRTRLLRPCCKVKGHYEHKRTVSAVGSCDEGRRLGSGNDQRQPGHSEHYGEGHLHNNIVKFRTHGSSQKFGASRRNRPGWGRWSNRCCW